MLKYEQYLIIIPMEWPEDGKVNVNILIGRNNSELSFLLIKKHVKLLGSPKNWRTIESKDGFIFGTDIEYSMNWVVVQ